MGRGCGRKREQEHFYCIAPLPCLSPEWLPDLSRDTVHCTQPLRKNQTLLLHYLGTLEKIRRNNTNALGRRKTQSWLTCHKPKHCQDRRMHTNMLAAENFWLILLFKMKNKKQKKAKSYKKKNCPTSIQYFSEAHPFSTRGHQPRAIFTQGTDSETAYCHMHPYLILLSAQSPLLTKKRKYL